MPANEDRIPVRPRLPEVDGMLCVHAIAVSANCRACVDACPTSAWVLGDDGLGLDTSVCDGCGICVPACPQVAIELPRAPPAISPDDPEIALVACELAVPRGGRGVMPCLNAIGLDELARLYREGVRKMCACTGDCAACSRGLAETFAQASNDLNRLLENRKLPGLAIEDWPNGRWLTVRDHALQPSRRSLFNAFRPSPPAEAPLPAARQPAARLLPPGRPQTPMHPNMPKLDADKCEACDACARICSDSAIAMRDATAERAAVYAIDPARCTGCGLCIDVCEANAVSLSRWTHDTPQDLVLDTAQCMACGNTYRMPRSSTSGRQTCRICAQTNHSRNLFQVMK